MIVVADATPLIALAKLERLTLLSELFGAIVIPQAVYDEVVSNTPNRPGSLEVRQATWIQVQAITNQAKLADLLADLDLGEAEALVLAEELHADWILLDESKARLIAQISGLKFIGTIGLLLLAKQTGTITMLRPLLDELRAKNFHLSQKLYQATIDKAGE
jgi:predicted nucleic acid-binding protein